METRIVNKIKLEEIYEENQFDTPIRNEDLIDSLKKDTRLVSTTGITAIENSRPELVNTCIRVLTTIGTAFLRTTREDDVTNTFMDDLNDQFGFLVSTARTENHEQKYLEQLAKSLGEISREALRTRDISDISHDWLRSTRNLFSRAITLEGNQAAGICIDEIGRTVLLTQRNPSIGASQEYSVYRGQLKDVALACAQDDRLIQFLQAALTYYEWQFIMMFNQLSDGSRYYQEHDLEYFFDEMSDIYLEAKSNYGSYMGLPQSVYGINSFTTKVFYFGLLSVNSQTAAAYAAMTSEPPEEIPIKNRGNLTLPDIQSQRYFVQYIEKYIGFHESILQDGSQEDEDGYSVYPENLYLILSTFQFDYIDSGTLVATLSDSWHSIIKSDTRSPKASGRQGGRPSTKARESLFDYYLILFYLFIGNENVLSNEVGRLADLHSSVVSNYGQQEAQWLYRYMKLFGAILDGPYDLQQNFPQYYNNLTQNFYQPGPTPGQAIVPPLPRMGYPDTSMLGSYSLSANQIWRGDRDKIEQSLLTNISDNAYRLHGKLNLKKNLPTAVNHAQRLSSRLP